MDIIKVTSLTKQIKKQVILDDVSLTINTNEIVGLIGPSGAGKTSLIKAMIGIESFNTGQVSLFETEIPNRAILQKVGYMAQNDALYNSLNAQENLELFGSIYGLSKKKLLERIDYVAEIVDLKKELKKKVANYSGGMKRRLSFAISLIQNPELLILDEPTVGLDPILRLRIWDELNELKTKDKTIIITTHVMDEVEHCDRLLLIREGKIIADGTPSNLKGEYQVKTIEEIFIKLGGPTHENTSDC